METCKSPARVMQVAYAAGRRCLPDHTCKFSRQDFTLPQLFACLVVRELFGLSFRRAEALLADSPAWLAGVGLAKAPDRNTLWRASDALLSGRRVGRVLDLMAELFARAKLLSRRRKPLAIDSTCYEQRHRSGHYDRRCRRMGGGGGPAAGRDTPDCPGKWGKSVNAARGRRLRRLPKLAVAVDAGCHLILSARARIGNGSDAPDFDGLLYDAWRRAGVKAVVADAGYDSEANHRIARQDMGVRSIIATGIGRPTTKPPTGRWRRHVKKRLSDKSGRDKAAANDQKLYGQRSQSETAHSMMKRNLSSALRARTPERQKKEMMMRVLTHNIMLLCDETEG